MNKFVFYEITSGNSANSITFDGFRKKALRTKTEIGIAPKCDVF